MKSILSVIAVATSCLLATSAQATILGFDDLPHGPLDGAFTEQGFDMTAVDLFAGSPGSEGAREIERVARTSGTLTIRTDRKFVFNGLDIQSENLSPLVSIEGFLDGASVGIDNFIATSAAYVTFSADVLAGVLVDRIVISPQRFGGSAAIDNVNVSAVPLPAPALLLLAGLGGLGLMRRRS